MNHLLKVCLVLLCFFSLSNIDIYAKTITNTDEIIISRISPSTIPCNKNVKVKIIGANLQNAKNIIFNNITTYIENYCYGWDYNNNFDCIPSDKIVVNKKGTQMNINFSTKRFSVANCDSQLDFYLMTYDDVNNDPNKISYSNKKTITIIPDTSKPKKPRINKSKTASIVKAGGELLIWAKNLNINTVVYLNDNPLSIVRSSLVNNNLTVRVPDNISSGKHKVVVANGDKKTSFTINVEGEYNPDSLGNYLVGDGDRWFYDANGYTNWFQSNQKFNYEDAEKFCKSLNKELGWGQWGLALYGDVLYYQNIFDKNKEYWVYDNGQTNGFSVTNYLNKMYVDKNTKMFALCEQQKG